MVFNQAVDAHPRKLTSPQMIMVKRRLVLLGFFLTEWNRKD